MADASDTPHGSPSGAWRVVAELAGEAAKAEIHEHCMPETVTRRDAIKAELVFAATSSKSRTLACQVQRLSPFAVELLPYGPCPALMPTHFELQLVMGNQTLVFFPSALFRMPAPQGGDLLIVRLAAAQAKTDHKREQRRLARWRCHPDFLPAASAAHPLRSAEQLHFKVADLSERGMQLLGSMKCMAILPKSRLSLSVTLLETGKINVNVEVAYAARVQLNDKSHMAFGVRLVDVSSRAAAQIGKYLAMHAGSQVPERPASEPKKALIPALSFRWVQSEADYEQVIALRRAARQERASAPAADAVAEPYDKRSRILLVCHSGQVIATLRMVYSQAGEGLEIEQYTDIGRLKLDKEQVVEVSQLRTHPDHRSADLLGSVMHFAMLTAVQSNKRYVLAWCTKDMLPLYERLGCDATAITLSAGFDDDKPRYVVVADTQKLLHGGTSTQSFKHFVGALGHQDSDTTSTPHRGDDAPLPASMAAAWTARLRALFTLRK